MEKAPMSVRYNENSRWQYDRAMALLAQSELSTGSTVLDLGCGTGTVTWVLARKVGPMGRVIGVDPDVERLRVARACIPEDLTHRVAFMEGRAEALPEIADTSIDFVYSNYVFHWIEDKDCAMAELLRCLRFGGRMAIEAVGMVPAVLAELCMAAGESGQRRLARFYCLSREKWEERCKAWGVEIEHLAWLDLPYEFMNVDSLIAWWEGTTHGDVLASNMSPSAMTALRARFPERVRFSGPSIQLVLRKPS